MLESNTLSVLQYAETLQPQVEPWSKRHSTSDLRTVTFSDVCKQGWLHYKQVYTEKRKVQLDTHMTIMTICHLKFLLIFKVEILYFYFPLTNNIAEESMINLINSTYISILINIFG